MYITSWHIQTPSKENVFLSIQGETILGRKMRDNIHTKSIWKWGSNSFSWPAQAIYANIRRRWNMKEVCPDSSRPNTKVSKKILPHSPSTTSSILTKTQHRKTCVQDLCCLYVSLRKSNTIKDEHMFHNQQNFTHIKLRESWLNSCF